MLFVNECHYEKEWDSFDSSMLIRTYLHNTRTHTTLN